jgi:hypothetical protein
MFRPILAIIRYYRLENCCTSCTCLFLVMRSVAWSIPHSCGLCVRCHFLCCLCCMLCAAVFVLLCHIRSIYRRKYCYGEENRFEILTDLNILSPPSQIRKSRFWYAVCLLVWIDVRLAFPWAVVWILFLFGIQEFTCHKSGPSEYEHSSFGPQNRKWL